MDHWHTIGLEPTTDKRAVKRAYAKKLKQHPPEKDPEGFKALRLAYEYLVEALDTEQPAVSINYGPDENSARQPPGGSAQPDTSIDTTVSAFDVNQDASQTIAAKLSQTLLEVLQAQGDASAIISLKRRLKDSRLIDLSVHQYFETSIVQYLLGCQIKPWPMAFARAFLSAFSIEKNISNPLEYQQLFSLIDQQQDLFEQREAVVKKQAIVDNIKSCKRLVESLKARFADRHQASALSELKKILSESRFEKPAVKNVFVRYFVERLQGITSGDWPLDFMGYLAEYCELTPQNRRNSPYKKAIDYIAQRTAAARDWQKISDYAEGGHGQPAQLAFGLLTSTEAELTGLNVLTAPVKNELKKILLQVNTHGELIWEHELLCYDNKKALEALVGLHRGERSFTLSDDEVSVVKYHALQMLKVLVSISVIAVWILSLAEPLKNAAWVFGDVVIWSVFSCVLVPYIYYLYRVRCQPRIKRWMS